jgi:hypothetical protein
MSRREVLAAFRLAWKEYLRLLESESQKTLDWMKFRTGKADAKYDDIRRVGTSFDNTMERDQGSDYNDACQCLKALG